MYTTDQVKKSVEEFYQRHATNSVQDAFVPWWLTRKFGLPAQEAIAKAPGGSNDYGLDGFHLELNTDPPILHLIQGKHSDSIALAKKGLLEFGRTMPILRQILAGDQTALPTPNSVLARLAASVQKHADLVGRIRIHFEVLHLCGDAEDLVSAKLANAFEKFEEMVRSRLPDNACAPLLLYPPRELSAIRVIPPTQEHILRFEGVPLRGEDGLAYYVGLGCLADLVELYGTYDYALFAKNVRSFLLRKAAKGPAKYIRGTLKRICVDFAPSNAVDPAIFAILHNGITLHACAAELGTGTISVRQPNVLNGCQTVKTAYLFRHDPDLKERIHLSRWNLVKVPLRVVVSTDEQFITDVAVGNNRQTELRPSAFRANDPVQLELATRFEKAEIYYERQEDAFANLRQSNARLVDQKFSKSFNRPIKIEELAQIIAAASDKPGLAEAARVSRLFEDPHYQRVFNLAKLDDIELLVFLRNLFAVTQLILKDLREQSAKLAGLPLGQFKYPAFRFLSRYVWKYQPDLIESYGDEVIQTFGTNHPLRVAVRKLCAWQNSGLQQLIPDVWMDPKNPERWSNPTDVDCMSRALKRAKLHDIDVFQRRRTL